jgi:uncharacterized protein with NRDE domain
MCLIAFALDVHPRWPLILIGNRDEYHARAATAAEFQPDAPHVYGGRDLEKQGGWLQVSERGRLAAVTNVRVGPPGEVAPRSRGQLVAGFVRGDERAPVWLAALSTGAAEYGRFNLLLWDGREAWTAGNHPAFSQSLLAAGMHGMSNGPLDADWPKVRRARAVLASWCEAGDGGLEPLFEALADQRAAPDEQLPDTGVGLALERMLSPPFIRGDRYGTRCSSVVLVGNDQIRFVERRFGPNGVLLGESDERFERMMG